MKLSTVKRSVVFKIPNHSEFEFIGDNNIIAPIEFRARSSSYRRVLAHLDAIPFDSSVVSDFIDIFENFLRFSPYMIVEFAIDLIPGTVRISRAPYQMGPVELEELKDQLDELKTKCFIGPNTSL